MFKIILFYKYTSIDDPTSLRDAQSSLCQTLNLKGRIIVSPEGINGTLEGEEQDINKYILNLSGDKRFKGIDFKISNGTGKAFPKLSVKARSEIVAGRLGEDDVKPWEVTGKYLHPEQLYDWIHSGKQFFIVDMRNDFEQQVGNFEGSILTKMTSFADLPKVAQKISHLKKKTIVTVCTGGVRCEKASGFLIKHGFSDVYQLNGGIVTYMEKYPNEDFNGALYVFDNRLVMGFNLTDPKRKIIGKCAKCNKPSENFINCSDHFCHRHFIACLGCLGGLEALLCPMGCRDYSKEHPEAFAL